MKPFYEEKTYDNLVARVVYRVTPIIWLTEVEPSRRRQGLGTETLQNTLKQLKGGGYQFAYCFLKQDDTRAIKFYEKNGFNKKWGDKLVYEVELGDEWTHSETHKQKWG